MSANFSAVTLTDGVAVVSGGSITGGTYIDTDVASVSANFSAVTLTDGVAVVSGGSITSGTYIDTDVASVSENFSAVTLTDGVAVVSGGSITGGTYIDTDVVSVSESFSAVTLTDGVAVISGGSISGGTYIDTNIASVSKNFSIGTLTDGYLSINGGTINNANLLKSNELIVNGNATISGNLAVSGSITVIHTDVNTSEQISVTNDGSGPALIVKQRGNQPVMNIMDTNAGSSINGNGVVKTSSSSTSVILNATDYNNISIDAEITANSVIRNVISKNGNNTITIDNAVDWDNSSAGYSFTYKNPIHALYIKDGGLVGIGTSNPTKELQVIGTSLLHTITDGVAIVSGGSISGGTYIDTDVASVSANFSAVTLTDGVAVVSGGSITGGTYIDTDVASVSESFSAVTLTDGVAVVSGGSITGGTYIDTDVASVSANFSAVTLTDGVAVVSGGSITGGTYIDTDVASVSESFSAVTLTDGVAVVSGGSITNGTYIDTDVASVSANFSAVTLTDGTMVVSGGSITNGTYIDTDVASISQNFSAVTLTDGTMVVSGGSITNGTYIDTDVASISQNFSVSTLTDSILSIKGGSISNINEVDTKYLKVSEIGSITGDLYIDSLSTITSLGSSLTTINSNLIHLYSTISGLNSIIINAQHTNGGISINSGTSGINTTSNGRYKVKLETETSANSIELNTNAGGVHIKAKEDILIESQGPNKRININSGNNGDVVVAGILHVLNNGNTNDAVYVKSSGSSGSGTCSVCSGNNNVITTGNLLTVGVPTTNNYTFHTSDLNIGTNTKISDAFLNLDNWLYENLIDSPPSFTSHSYSQTNSYIEIKWNLPTRKYYGFSDVKLPAIYEIKIDFKKIADNWNDNSKVTTIVVDSNLYPTSKIDVKILSTRFYISAGTSGVDNVDNTLYNYYQIDSEEFYDFRVYGLNSSTKDNRYVYYNNLRSGSIGVPDKVTSLATSNITTTGVTVSYVKPNDHDVSLGSVQNYPDIDNYKILIDSQSSSRYPSVITQNISSLTSLTSINFDINPGTTYQLSVSTKNIINSSGGSNNDGYSAVETINFNSTVPDNSNDISNISSNNLYNFNCLSSGYSLDGNNQYNIFNSTYINSVLSNKATATLLEPMRIHNTVGSTLQNASTLTLSNNFNSSLSLNLSGFNNTHNLTTYNNSNFELILTKYSDKYIESSNNFQGFFMDSEYNYSLLNFNNTYNSSSSNSYNIKFVQEIEGNTLNSTQLDFRVDDVASPAIANYHIFDIESSTLDTDYGFVSGLYTPYTSANLKFAFESNTLYHYYLPANKLLAVAKIYYLDSNNNKNYLTNSINIAYTDFDGSNHSFYSATGDYTNSSTKVGNGYTIQESDYQLNREINDFKISFNTNDYTNYTNDLKVEVVYHNTYGSLTTDFSMIDNNGNTKKILFDPRSIYHIKHTIYDASNNLYGLKVRSGYDASTKFYPSGPGTNDNDFGDSYDHSKDISSTNNPRYDNELIYVNGEHVSAYYNYYIDYSNYYYPSNISNYSYPNYSSITSSASNYRFVTFKYTGVISNANGCRLYLQNWGNLPTSVYNTDMSLHIKIHNSSVSSNNTAWLDANEPFDIGVNTYSKTVNGTRCLSVYRTYISTNILKYCYLDNPTTGDLYIRIGLKMNSNIKIGTIKVENNLSP